MRGGISATYGSDRLLYVVELRVDGFFRIVDRLCGGRPARVALDSSANKRLQVVLLLLLFDLLLELLIGVLDILCLKEKCAR